MNAKTFLSASFAALAFAVAAPAMASTMGDADPGYPAAATSTTTRAAVKADLATSQQARTATAAQAGGFRVQGEAFYFPEPVGEAKTRAQVRAETLEAIRVGAISRSERYVFPTTEQLDSIRLAGQRALDPNVAASRGPAVN